MDQTRQLGTRTRVNIYKVRIKAYCKVREEVKGCGCSDPIPGPRREVVHCCQPPNFLLLNTVSCQTHGDPSVTLKDLIKSYNFPLASPKR